MLAGMFASRATGGGGGPTQDFAFDPLDKNSGVVLSNSNKTASVGNEGSSIRHVMCTSPKNSGKPIFEFNIDSMPPTTGRIMIGLASSPAIGSTTTSVWNNSGPIWWVRKSSAVSRVYYDDGSSSFDELNTATQSFDTGDRITMTVDFSSKEVNFYRNGTPIYTKTIANINTSTYVYAPVVKLWGTDTPATVSIPSDIMYPVEGFDPLA